MVKAIYESKFKQPVNRSVHQNCSNATNRFQSGSISYWSSVLSGVCRLLWTTNVSMITKSSARARSINQSFRKFLSKIEWVCSVKPKKISVFNFRGAPLFLFGSVRSKWTVPFYIFDPFSIPVLRCSVHWFSWTTCMEENTYHCRFYGLLTVDILTMLLLLTDLTAFCLYSPTRSIFFHTDLLLG